MRPKAPRPAADRFAVLGGSLFAYLVHQSPLCALPVRGTLVSMSRDEELSATGRMLEDFLAAKRKLAALEQEVERTSQRFRAISDALKKGEPLDRRELVDLFDAEHVLALSTDLQNAMDHKRNLLARLKAFG